MNRIVDFFAKRPQTQEKLALQVKRELQKSLNTKDVICVIDAKNLCSNTGKEKRKKKENLTIESGGIFKQDTPKNDFLEYLNLNTRYH